MTKPQPIHSVGRHGGLPLGSDGKTQVGLTAAATSVESLPSTGTDVPGLWIVATAPGTRYVLVVPPEGQSEVMRVAAYGWSRNSWKPLRSACRVWEDWDEPRVPVEVGSGMHVQMGPSRDDWYRSTEVASILSYPLPALLSVDEAEAYAHAAMRDSTISLAATAYAEGRIDDQTLTAICAEQGFTLAEVKERLP